MRALLRWDVPLVAFGWKYWVSGVIGSDFFKIPNVILDKKVKIYLIFALICKKGNEQLFNKIEPKNLSPNHPLYYIAQGNSNSNKKMLFKSFRAECY